MPNYSLVNPVQKVISFEDLIKPYQMYSDEVEKQEAAMSALMAQVGDWEKLKDEPGSEQAYNRYKDYYTKLEELAGDIAANGLRNNAKGRAKQLAATYGKEIAPISEAWERRKKLADLQYQLGPNAIHEFSAANTGLDKFMANPMLTPKYLDKAAIAKNAEQAYATLTNDLAAATQGPNIDKYHKTFLQKYGISTADATKFMNMMQAGDVQGAMRAYPQLGSIFTNQYNATGVDAWKNPEASDAVRNSILGGVYSAIGKSSVQMYEDKEAVGALELRNRIRAERAARAMTETPSPQYALPGVVPFNLISSNEKTKVANQYEKFKQYFYRDPVSGGLKLRHEGVVAYNKGKINPWVSESAYRRFMGGKKDMTGVPTKEINGKKVYRLPEHLVYNGKKEDSFAYFVDKVLDAENKGIVTSSTKKGVAGLETTDYKLQPGNLGNAFAQWRRKSSGETYDTHLETAYRYNIENSDDWKTALKSALKGQDRIAVVEYDDKTKTYKEKEKRDIKKIWDSKAKIISAEVSSGGRNVLNIETGDNEIIQIKLPNSMNPAIMKQVNSYIGQASSFAKLAESKGLSEEDKDRVNEEYKMALASMYAALSQVGYTNKTKPQEFEVYGEP